MADGMGNGAGERVMRHVAAGALVVLAWLPASGARAEAKPACTQNADYLVVEKDHGEDAVGSSYIVRDAKATPKPSCTLSPAPGDVVIGTAEDPFFLQKLEGRFLVIDSGTGPSRELLIYDLRTGQRAYQSEYDEESLKFEPGRILFWSSTGTPATSKNCPRLRDYEKQGFGARLDVQTVFDTATGKATSGTKTRCTQTQ